MDRAQFWRIIESAKRASVGNDIQQIKLILEGLQELAPEEIISFEEIHVSLQSESYRNDLWAAAYIINGGCSDDGFDYFRGWLVAQGQRVFEDALKDPGTLVNQVVMDSGWDAELEDMLSVGHVAYREATGEEMPTNNYQRLELIGDSWDEDGVDLLYPELAERANSRWD